MPAFLQKLRSKCSWTLLQHSRVGDWQCDHRNRDRRPGADDTHLDYLRPPDATEEEAHYYIVLVNGVARYSDRNH